MSVRKRRWTTSKGEVKEAWVVAYGTGKARHIQTFSRKKDADAYHDSVKVDVRKGVHVAPSKSPTVREAGKSWIAACEAANLERVTVEDYQSLLDLHLYPFLGDHKLSALTVAAVRQWQDDLRTAAEPRSPSMVKRVTGILGSLLADAQERGHIGQNVVRNLKSSRRRGKERQAERRAKGKLAIGVDIPTPKEIDAILGAAGKDRALILVLVRCGLRASEARGLRWQDIDFDKAVLHVRQRADRYGEIGQPKSESGDRSIPIPPSTLLALKEWKLRCPRRAGELHYVFPNGKGNVENRNNIVNRKWRPAQVRAGVAIDTGEKDEKGKPIFAAKYTGLHATRHFFASWCINRKSDGGLELPAKVVQERLGHSSIALTMDLYSHLFPRGDDSAELAAAEGKFG